MKKIITVLFLIVNALLFFSVLDVYKEKDLVYINQIQKYHPDGIMYYINIDNGNRELESQAMFASFKELTEQYDLMISAGLGDFPNDQYEFYFAMDVDVDKQLGLVTDRSVNFNHGL